MSTVEVAASLFGPDGDSGPDPFAVIGNDSDQSTTTTPTGLTVHEYEQRDSVLYSSDMGQDASNLFAEHHMAQGAQHFQQDSWSVPAQEHSSSGDSSQYLNGSAGGYEQSQEWYSSNSYPPTQPQVSYDQQPGIVTGAANVYHQYRPDVNLPSQYNGSQNHHFAPVHGSYDPYKPITNLATTHALQPAVASADSQGAYDPYNSVTRSVFHPHSSSAAPSIPPPPVLSAPSRPQTSNAYDPPLPPLKVSKRAVSARAPTVGQYAPYSQLSQAPSPVPPVPPSNSAPYGSLPNSVAQLPVSPPPPRAYVTDQVPNALDAGSVKTAYKNYEPKSYAAYERSSSPAVHHSRQASPALDPYAPTKNVSVTSSEYRGRSGSNISLLSTGSQPVGIPSHREVNGFPPEPHPADPSSYGAVSAYSQELHILHAARPPYAPSPSLLGTNDLLGRTSARAPVISFGFGGKIVTCFHSSPDLITGFDVALSSRHSTDVRVRVLHKILPEFALEPCAAAYPGPLFSDPSTPAGIVRTGLSSQIKTKKARVVKYLEHRIEELSRGTTYTSEGTEKQHVEGKLVLVKLLNIMVENDGALSGSAHIDSAVRTALLPRISAFVSGENASSTLSTPAFASPMPNAHGIFPALHVVPIGTSETPISITTLFPSALDKIHELLVRGERKQAYHYALDEKLWAHAMVIASSIDKEAWKDVVNEFLKAELGVQDAQPTALLGRGKEHPLSNGRESLRVIYSLFSGQGPAAVQELVPTNLLARATGTLQVPTPAAVHTTPMSPSFPSPAIAAQIPVNALSKWPEIVAAMISSPPSSEWSATLTALGDYLASHQLIEAAHACYLLSPQTSPLGGIGNPSARVVLIGSRNPHSWSAFFKDTDTLVLSEITEFALSLKSIPKGQEPFHGLPHLQAYKLIRASYLAEIGEMQAASRYCEVITAAMTYPSPYFNSVVVEQLKGLADRLIGAPQMEKSGSWIGGKVNKPSLDSIGSWLEGRLTKFIAGEGDELTPQPEPTKTQHSSFGPFSHFSEISSTTTSASPSPPPGAANLHSMSGTPPRRSGSAMAVSTSHAHVPIDRASSAMEYYHPTRKASPAPPTTAPLHRSAYSFSTHGVGANGHPTINSYVPAYTGEATSRTPSLEMTAEEGPEQQQQETGWWSSLSSSDSGPTPTTTTFHPVNNFQASSDGFISLMDDPALAAAPSASMSNHQPRPNVEDEEDDLGFGNHAFSRERPQEAGAGSVNHQRPTMRVEGITEKPEERKDTKSSSSWLARPWFWKRSEPSPGVIKANLGEESTFYYDKELKRWISKEADVASTQPAAPPPPPSRAQTTSPGGANVPPPHGIDASSALPPARTASAIDLSTSPTAKSSTRVVRSNLAPPEATSLPNTPSPARTPTTSMTPPPPPSRPRSQAAKRNVRNRYVDVFQQQENAS